MKRQLLSTLLIIIWLAALTHSAASLLDAKKSKSEKSHSVIPVPNECLRLCADERVDKIARCNSLPRRERAACMRRTNQDHQECKLECAEPK